MRLSIVLVIAAALPFSCKGEKGENETTQETTPTPKERPIETKPPVPKKAKAWSASFEGVDIEPMSGQTIIAGPVGSAFSVKMIGSASAILDLLIEPLEAGKTGSFVPTTFSVQIPGGYSCGFNKAKDDGSEMTAILTENAGKKVAGTITGELRCKHLVNKDEPEKTAQVNVAFKK